MTDKRRPRFRFSAPVRVVMLAVAFSLIITLPVLLFVYHQTDRLFENRIVNRIDDRESNLLHGYRTGGVAGLVKAIDDEVETGIVRGGAILLVDRSGRKLAGNLAAWPSNLGEPTRWTEERLFTQDQSHPQLFALRIRHLPTGERLLFGTNVDARERMRESLIEALLGALLLAIPLGLLLSLVLVRVSDRHIRGVAAVSERIARGDFSHRIDATAEDEQFQKLAAAINVMLERIEELVNQLRLVTDALAHDLRSPLTRMRANIERAATASSDDVRDQALEGISNEIDGMLRLMTATLEISRTEAGIGRENFERFDLGALLRDLCEMYHPLCEERGIAMDSDTPPSLELVGNRELIGQAVSNLIDNALKYGAGGGEIRVGVEHSGESIRLWVADRGPGIPQARRDEALRKYGRLEEARTAEGSGLGLALVRAVARLHGGELLLEDNEPGLRVVMLLPRNDSGR